MSDLLPILQSINRGSSGRGMSYYMKVGVCPRKAWLDEQNKDRNIEREHHDMSKLDRGTMTHALLEAYHATPDGVVELSDMGLSNVVSEEVIQWFRFYQRNFRPDFWGKVVGVELQFPRNEEDTRILSEFLGIPDFTFRPDMMVEMTQEDIARLEKHFQGLCLNGPGIYVIDWKTAGQKNANDAITYPITPQFMAYQMCLTKLGYNIQGMIAAKLVFHKDPEVYKVNARTKMVENHSVLAYFARPPTDLDQKAVKEFLQYAFEQAKTNEPRLTACIGLYDVCHHYMAGTCSRVKE